MIDKYDNQDEIDELQQKLSEISPGLRVTGFTVWGNRAGTAFVYILEKGNKKVIDQLIALGFRKVRRQKVRTSDYWTLSATHTMEVVLEKALGGR